MIKTSIRSTLVLVVGAAALALASPRLGAQQPTGRGQVIEVHHENRSARLITPQHWGTVIENLERDHEVRIRTSGPAAIRISGTNSALYECTVSQTSTSVPEVEQLRGFLSAFGPYATELGAKFESGVVIPPDDPSDPAIAEVARHLTDLNAAITAMNDVRISTIATLEAMRLAPTEIRFRADALDRSLPAELPFLRQILTSLGGLTSSTALLNRDLASSHPTVKAAGAALEKADAIIAAAYSTVSLASLARKARDTIDCEAVQVRWDRGRDVAVKVTPRGIPELQRLADRPPLEFKTRALPRSGVSPAVGLSLLYAPNASYSQFGTIKAPGDSAEIIVRGTQDSRVILGLTLGARFQRVVGGTFDLHLPEITINPLTNERAIGVGGGLSYGVLKLGGGGIWTRRAVLEEGQQVGTRLRDAAFLRTTNTYGPLTRPDWYVSLSFMGWPPFVQSK